MEEKKTYKTADEKGKCVFAAPIARELIHKGHTVIDIKPNRENHEKTVFVFRTDDSFNADFEEIRRAYNEKKAQKRGWDSFAEKHQRITELHNRVRF